MVAGNMWPVETLHNELRLYRLSKTRQRDAVYLAIGRLGPVQRAAIAAELAGEIDRRTAYRTIKTFLNARVIRELPDGLIELAPHFIRERYYILCWGCGRRTPFWDPALEKSLNRILARRRFVLPAHQMQLSGLCRLCTEQI